ncbi:autotransporter outer membrane beta-barrel domain-containing protein [Pseudomonas sp. NPDC089569]|uniref:autotransporter outer membrane beta-barrel domain-containing protein n=1 Tax=Pseudomonas sp. NPDC089569 TaxID=3390722 RepID=UPI003CFD0538
MENVEVKDGNFIHVGEGGVVINATVNKGHLQVWNTGAAIGTTINGKDGWLEIDDNSSAVDSVLNTGQMVVKGSATANGTTVNAGFLDVAQNGVANDTQLKAGAMYVYMDGSAVNTRIDNAQMTVYQNGSTDLTRVNSGGLLSIFDSATATRTVVDQGGQFEIDAGTTVHDTTVNQGGRMVMADRAEAANTTINEGGLLQLKGDAILGFSTQVSGQVGFADPAINGFHTLLIKGPLSGNGTFFMNTDLAGQQGDLLDVRGPISGHHTLVVADSGKAIADARPLTLVAGNGGSGDFTLHGGTVDAGAFRYQLQQVGEDWYLTNAGETAESIEQPDDNKDPVPKDESVQPVFPADPAEPERPARPTHRPQPEILSKGANAAVASQAAGAALINAQMNATTGHFAELRSGKDQGGVWTRGYGTEQHLDTGTSRAFEQQVNGMEIGADKAIPLVDGTLYVGALFGQGKARQSFDASSKGTIDSTTLGTYASYQERGGLYVDGALKYSRLDNDINITSNVGKKAKASFKSHAVSADVQLGKRIELDRGWFAEPQVGVQITHISGARYTADNGLEVKQDSMNSVQSRVGGIVGRDLALDNGLAIKPYVKAGWVTEHAGKSHVKVSGTKLDSRLPGSRVEFAGGVALKTATHHSLYAEAGYTRGSEIEQPWAVTVGYRYNW